MEARPRSCAEKIYPDELLSHFTAYSQSILQAFTIHSPCLHSELLFYIRRKERVNKTVTVEQHLNPGKSTVFAHEHN